MIEQLKLYDVKSPKIRLGNEWDGGYVVPQIILDSSLGLFSYGVGSDISFEIDYVKKTNKPSFFFDHTIEGVFIPQDLEHLMVFKKEGLSFQKEQELNTFFFHYEQSNIKGSVILKIDIEGSEFPYFLNTEIEKLSKIVSGIIVEFHPIGDNILLNQYFESVKKINEYFYHCHFHANNYAGSSQYNEGSINIIFPHVIEMTFVNKHLISKNKTTFEKIFNIFKSDEKISLDMSDYPTEYDRRNNLSNPEHSLEFLKLINKI